MTEQFATPEKVLTYTRGGSLPKVQLRTVGNFAWANQSQLAVLCSTLRQPMTQNIISTPPAEEANFTGVEQPEGMTAR